MYASDAEKSAQFYEKTFNAKKVESRTTRDGRTSVELNLNGARILVAHPSGKPPFYGLDHFGLRTDNIEAAVADLKAKGIKFRDEILETRPGTKRAFFWAPENVLIELMEKKS